MIRIYRKHRHFILYVIIGSFAFLVDAGIFFLLLDTFRIHYVMANIVSVFIGIWVSFLLNARFNFKKRDKWTARLVSFFAVCLLGMTLGTLFLSFFYEIAGFWKFISKLLSVILAGGFQFLFNKNVTFRD